MAELKSNLKTKCIGIRNDQIEWYERNDINFSKLVRRLVDDEIKYRESSHSEKQSNDATELFDHIKSLVAKENKNSPAFNPDKITLDWLKTLIDVAFPCLGDHYALLTDNEKRILEAGGIDTGLFTND